MVGTGELLAWSNPTTMENKIDLTKEWSTHLPVLVKLLSLTSGRVLEIGTGVYSTPLLHWLCLTQGRELVSVENDPKWIEYARKFEEPNHEVVSKIPEGGEWDIVFIDSFPHETRRKTVEKFAKNAKYVVVHDFDGRESYADIFKNFYHYTALYPETGIFSNITDLSKLKI